MWSCIKDTQHEVDNLAKDVSVHLNGGFSAKAEPEDERAMLMWVFCGDGVGNL